MNEHSTTQKTLVSIKDPTTKDGHTFEIGDTAYFMRLNNITHGKVTKKIRTQTETVDVTWYSLEHSEGTSELRIYEIYKSEEALIKSL